jgi:MFS family permease
MGGGVVTTALQADMPLGTSARTLPLRQVAAVGLGNALEFYDWYTFSIFAVQIAHTFYPATATSHGLLFTLATFGAGFVTRPLGGVLIGTFGDRVGRKPAMLLSFALMGMAMAGVALTPSYGRIGYAAPALLLLFRLIQGFALGGDIGPTTAYLIETAPRYRRGLYVSLQYATQDTSVLVAGAVGFILSTLLDSTALNAWGWRLAFLLGASVVPVGLMVRRRLPESFEAIELPPSRHEHRVPSWIMVTGFLILGATAIINYVQNYIATFAQDSLHLTAVAGFSATAVSGLCMVSGDLLTGFLSDRLGRKPVMIVAALLLIAVLVPAYMAMLALPGMATLLAGIGLIGFLFSVAMGPAIVMITESLPSAVRSGRLAILYAVAMATCGGTTQFIIKWLIDAIGSPLAPAWYATGALAIGAVAMVVARETAPVKQPR